MSKYKSSKKKIKKPKQRPENQFELLRKKASELFYSGAMVQACQIQERLVEHKDYMAKCNINNKKVDYKLYLTILYHLSLYSKAVIYAEKMVSILPDDSESWERLGACYLHCNRIDEGIVALETANQKSAGNNSNIFSALAHAFAKLNKLEKARDAGKKTLQIKAFCQQGANIDLIPDELPCAFNNSEPEKNIISFSLFGHKSEYCESAIINVREAKVYYPAWQCRFYCDETVPQSVRFRLTNSGAQVVMMPKPERWTDGLFWRFLVMDDTNVDRFLIRDCDSIVNSREAAAVDEWIASNKYFHLMRDSFNHTELILAGMFGGVQGVIPDIAGKIDHFQSQKYAIQTHLDQDFLRKVVWPTFSQSLCSHDRCFDFFQAKPFPANTELPDDRHVGDNKFSTSVNKTDAVDGTRFKWSLYKKNGELICEYIEVAFGGEWNISIPSEYGDKLLTGDMKIKGKVIKEINKDLLN